MKKLFFTLLIAAVSVCAFAQKGQKAVGLNLSYGSEIENLGIGIKGQYNFTDALRSEVSFDYFFKKNGCSMWDINVNAHYLFSLSEKVKVYPLAGLTYTNWIFDNVMDDYDNDYDYDYDDDIAYAPKRSKKDSDEGGSSSTGKFGINLGGGIQYNFTDKVFLNGEIKYQIINNFNQLVFGVGVGYKF